MRISIVQALLLLLFTFNLCATNANSQEVPDKTFSINVENGSINYVLKQVEKQTTIKFVFSSNAIRASRSMSLSTPRISIADFLKLLQQRYGIGNKIIDGQVVLFDLQNLVKPRVQRLSNDKIKEANREVAGTVTGDNGEPLVGVTVTEKGTKNITITDASGNFSITVGDVAVLEFSYVGYQPRELPVTSSEPINVSLTANPQDMNEIIVVGYGTQRRGEVTGAVDKVNADALEDRPSVNLVQSLQGTAPSLVIQQRNYEPGQGLNINIRGVGTMGDNAPLVVVDGIAGGNLDMINPSDIESVSILKDAGTAAIYGSRSANGVILVTTKKGRKNADATITYNGIVGIQKPKIWFKPVQSYENAILRNEANVNGGGSPIYTASQIQDFKDRGSEQWFVDAILKSAMQQNHNLSVTGGSNKTSYLLSGGYVNQRSNLVGPNLGLRRYNFRMNLSTEIGRLKVVGTFSYAKRQILDHSSNTGTLIVDASRVPTYYKIKDSLGNYLTNETTSELNSLGILEKGGTRKYDDDDLFGSVSGELSLFKGLKLKGVFGATLFSGYMLEHRKFVQFYMNGVKQGSYGSERNLNERTSKNLFVNPQIMLEYNRKFNQHSITGLFGYANESVTNKTSEINKRYVDNELGTNTDETIIDENTHTAINGTNETSLNSVFGRAGYSFSNRYMAEFNFRYDGSSKFAKGSRWGFFPSVSAGWNVTNENFMLNFWKGLTALKIRGSYGDLGNQNVGNYQYQTTYFVNNNVYGFNNDATTGAYYTLANPDITWETGTTMNLGLDATLFTNRLSFSFDYFNKLTKDILIRPTVSGVYGGDASDYNAGKIRNRGWELNINYNSKGEVLKHSIGFNIGDTKNEVIHIEGGERISSSDEMQFILREGLPFNSYVGLKRDGYFQNLNEVTSGPKPPGISVQPGDIRYVDVDKNGVIDDKDRFVLGNPFPRYTFGFNYSVKWKFIDFAVFVQGVGKRTQFLRGELIEPFHFNYSQVMYQNQLDYWTPANPDAKYPRLASAGSMANTNNFRRGSDLYIFGAAYARLKNIQLGFELPPALAGKAGLQKARFYLTGQNIFTLSKLNFLDPETSEFDNSLRNSGANSGRMYPTPVYYGIGLDITFK